MHKNLKFLLCFIYFICTRIRTECSACVDKIKYEIKTINKDYNYETEHFETEVISPSKKTFSITLEGNVPVLCKKMLHVTAKTYHFYGSNVGLEEIEPGTFDSQNIISQLRLSYNSLTVIRTGTFKNILITDLDLTRNKIVTIEQGALENLPKLQILNLGRNNIKQFHPNSIILTPKLTFFDMSRNNLEKLEEKHFSFMTTERNVGIGLAENDVKEIHPKAFEGIDVFTLNLTKNHLSSIPKEVYRNKLHFLGIAYNDLTHLDQEFFNLNTAILRDVQIEGNQFDEERLTKLKPFMEIIEGNRREDQKYHQADDTIHYTYILKCKILFKNK